MVLIGHTQLKDEKIEQIANEVISIFAQNNLNYDSSIYLLDNIKEKLGEKSFIKSEF